VAVFLPPFDAITTAKILQSHCPEKLVTVLCEELFVLDPELLILMLEIRNLNLKSSHLIRVLQLNYRIPEKGSKVSQQR